MYKRSIYRITILFAAIVMGFAATSCSPVDLDFNYIPDQGRTETDETRLPLSSYRNVFIVYSMGYNNLSSYLRTDISELKANARMNDLRDRVIILSHLCIPGNYKTPQPPILMELSTDAYGEVICDTLKTYPDDVIAADAATVREVLTEIKNEFPAESYGILFSSHGTGWTPENYCIDPSKFDKDENIWISMSRRMMIPKPEWIYPENPEYPMVKGIGVHNLAKSTYKEMEIQDLADAIPMKMDYIIFDACFMGGVEVAYELRDICDMMIASQTEIIAEGMDYTTMVAYLLNGKSPDLEGFCKNYFDYYNGHSSSIYRSATVSLTDCRKLDLLADVCREIFEDRRTGIMDLEGSGLVQPYYQRSYADLHKWFFDLESIAMNCGASEDQLTRLQNALKECIRYKAATKSFFNSEIKIEHHCGLSMYLPYKDRTYLNNYYKTLEWNKATGLVQ